MKNFLKKLYYNNFVLKIYAKITNFFSFNSLKILYGGGTLNCPFKEDKEKRQRKEQPCENRR